MTMSLRFPLATFALASVLLLPASPTQSAGSRYDKNAQALARALAPSGPAKSYNPQSVGGLGKRMIGIIQVLEKSYRTSGPPPESLLSKAFSFSENTGKWEELLLTNSLLNAWREASAMGLFDEHGNFRTEISKGRGVGDRVLFELIIPGDAYPPGSNQLANLRLVREDQKRDPKAPLSLREQATLDQLKKMVDEKSDLAERAKWENRKANKFGQTKEEEEKIWKERAKEAGDKVKELPNIRITGNLEATPAHMTQHRWRIGCEIINQSPHPTQVKLEIWLLGYTDKKRDHYVMAKSVHDLKLVASQVQVFDVFTKAKNSYKNKADDHDGLTKEERKRSRVRYRGYVMKVTHEKGVPAWTGSDQALTSYADPSNTESKLGSLPVF
jgi:hypothetical protein